MKAIQLKNKGLVAWVDDEDFERVSEFNWTAHRGSKGRTWYAVTNPTINYRRVFIRLHRFLLDLPPGSIDEMTVDHIDGDGLNNRRGNLEAVPNGVNVARNNSRRKKVEEPCL